MSARKQMLPAVAIGVAAVTALVGAVVAYGDPSAAAIGRQASMSGGQHTAVAAEPAPILKDDQSAGDMSAVFLAAGLSGNNEVQTMAGQTVGDQDGRATAVVQIEGNQVSFAIRWQNINAPTAFRLSQGRAGTNGSVEIDLFDSSPPGGGQEVTGSVTVTDRGLLDSIRASPTAFYLNLYTAEFPAGAVRGQTHALKGAVDPSVVLSGTNTAELESIAESE